MRRHRFRAGWFFLDTVMAIAIVAILLIVLTAAVTRQRKAADRLADSRDAMRLAEQTMTSLQSGRAVTQAPGGGIRVEKLDTPSDLPQCAWARVTVTRGNSSRELIGLVRADALPKENP